MANGNAGEPSGWVAIIVACVAGVVVALGKIFQRAAPSAEEPGLQALEKIATHSSSTASSLRMLLEAQQEAVVQLSRLEGRFAAERAAFREEVRRDHEVIRESIEEVRRMVQELKKEKP